VVIEAYLQGLEPILTALEQPKQRPPEHEQELMKLAIE
jgi:hypothetical protein